MITKLAKNLFLICYLWHFPHIAQAIDYYWQTTHPPGDVLWNQAHTLSDNDVLYVNDPLSSNYLVSFGDIVLNSQFTNTQTFALGGVIQGYYTGYYYDYTNATLTINNNGEFITTGGGLTSFFGNTITGSGTFTNSSSSGAIVFNDSVYNVTGVFTNNVDAEFLIGSSNTTTIFAPGNNSINHGLLTLSTNNTFIPILSIPGTFTNTGTIAIRPSGGVTLMVSITGAGTLYNNGTIMSSSITTAIINNSTHIINNGNINLTRLILSNSGTLTHNSGTITGSGDLSNSGIIELKSSIAATGTLTNTSLGSMIITGHQTIASTNFISPGSQNYTITDETTFDRLQASGAVDIKDGIIYVTSSFIGTPNSQYSWDILTADTPITINDNTVIRPPANTSNTSWSGKILSNIVRIFLSVSDPAFTPLPGVDTALANVLNNMSQNVTNAGQTALLATVNSATTQSQYNYILTALQPNITASMPAVSMQNIGFNKIETRVGNVSKRARANPSTRKATQNKNKTRGKTKSRSHTKPRSKNKTAAKDKKISGFSSGDLSPNTAMWISSFGSLSKQHVKDDSPGYRAKILGGMIGIDMIDHNNNVYGVALGLSNANVFAITQTTCTTRILGYNAMIYGANNLPKNWAAEWIVSGVITKNYGIRNFSFNGTDLSTAASYRGALGGARLNLVKSYNLNANISLSPVSTIQYVLVHQQTYDEHNSVAALHINPKNNSSILTVGAGTRLQLLDTNSWLVGDRDLSAMLTYDCLSPKQVTIANFVVGSDTFLMSSSSARLALKLGVNWGVRLYRNLDLQFSYNYEVRSAYYDNFAELKFRYLF